MCLWNGMYIVDTILGLIDSNIVIEGDILK